MGLKLNMGLENIAHWEASLSVALTRYYLCYKIKEKDIGGARMYGGEKSGI